MLLVREGNNVITHPILNVLDHLVLVVSRRYYNVSLRVVDSRDGDPALQVVDIVLGGYLVPCEVLLCF